MNVFDCPYLLVCIHAHSKLPFGLTRLDSARDPARPSNLTRRPALVYTYCCLLAAHLYFAALAHPRVGLGPACPIYLISFFYFAAVRSQIQHPRQQTSEGIKRMKGNPPPSYIDLNSNLKPPPTTKTATRRPLANSATPRSFLFSSYMAESQKKTKGISQRTQINPHE